MPKTKKNVKTQICVACDPILEPKTDKKTINSTTGKKSMWLRQLRRAVVPVHTEAFKALQDQKFPEKSPDGANIEVTLTFPKKTFSKILYWGSYNNDMDQSDPYRVKGSEYAYAEYTNIGVAVCHQNTIVIKLKCPPFSLCTQYVKVDYGIQRVRVCVFISIYLYL